MDDGHLADVMLDDFFGSDVKTPEMPPKREAPKGRKPATESGASNPLGYTPGDMQQIALRSLITESQDGNVQASKALLEYTEDLAIASNEDLRNMSLKGLAEVSKMISEDFMKLSTVGATQ